MLHCNCGDNRTCSCGGHGQNHESSRHSVKVNIVAGAKRATFEGRETLVVPVIMIKSDVVMNDYIVPVEELFPVSWNGVPVTIGHPPGENDAGSANSPTVYENMAVGTIFNSVVVNGILKAEAWIDIEKANRLVPGLVETLEAGEPMDVSTGYFSEDEDTKGQSNGKSYERICRNLNPDHLALLPGGVGACSWEDGCGVRANRKESAMNDKPPGKVDEGKVQGALSILAKALGIRTNKRGSDDDYRQIVADLISSDATPFTPSSEDGLRMMDYEALVSLRDQYLGGDGAAKGNTEGGGDVATNDDKDKAAKENASGLPKTMEELTALITNTVKSTIGDLPKTVTEAVGAALKGDAVRNALLTDDDRAALARAAKNNEDHKAQLVAKVVANSDIKKEDAEKMDLAMLELVANGLRISKPDYFGGAGVVVNTADDDPEVKGMSPPSTKDAIINRRKEMN